MNRSEKIELMLFILSFLNRWLLLLFLLYLLYRAFYTIEDGLKTLFVIAIRTIMSPKIAVPIESFQMLKWIMIFGIATLILIRMINGRMIARKKNVIVSFGIFLFTLFVIGISPFNSTFPIISIFKAVSFGYVFITILLGINATCFSYDWGRFVYKWLSLVVWSSALFAIFPIGYYLTTSFLQGITNQSNMLGIVAAFYVAFVIYLLCENRKLKFLKTSLCVGLFCVWMSHSRTALLSVVITSIVWLLAVRLPYGRKHKILLGVFLSAGILFLIPATRNVIVEETYKFVFKGKVISSDNSVEDIFASREKQKESFLTKYDNNIWIGSGFQTPYISGMKSWTFNFNMKVEPGNIVYAVLGDTGIIGFILFLIMGIILLCNVENTHSYLILSIPFSISLGEMVFFSVNNIAIILYLVIGISLFGSKRA